MFTLRTNTFVDGVTTVPASWFNGIAVDTSRAVDGAAGGAYAPTSPLVWGGSGLHATALLTADNFLIPNGSVGSVAGDLTIASGGSATIANSGILSVATGGLEIHHGRSIRRRGRNVLSDANHTIDVTVADRFELVPNPASARIITCSGTIGTPQDGETMELIWVPNTSSLAFGLGYTIRNAAGINICQLVMSPATNDGTFFVELELVSGIWRLGANSGSYWDGAADRGVVPGSGA